MNAPQSLSSMHFDDSNIPWQKLGELEHLMAWVYHVDESRNIVDFIVKFAPNQKIILHGHPAPAQTFVVQGEHRIYEPDGKLKEVRKVGSYTAGKAGGAPHTEGGGEEGCIVLYSIRGDTPRLLDLMDDDQNILQILDVPAFKAVLDTQPAFPA